MRKIYYDVATSLDGYIAGPDEDISAIPMEGDHVDAYGQRLAGYDTVIMGRKTYEFGFRFGLKPGQRAYPHMRHLIFSRSLDLPDNSSVEIVRENWPQAIQDLKNTNGGDIYLCGGGQFAGLLLSHGLIDCVRLKMAPVVLSGGIALFADAGGAISMQRKSATLCESGVTYLEYEPG